jgi:hypothetical protein
VKVKEQNCKETTLLKKNKLNLKMLYYTKAPQHQQPPSLPFRRKKKPTKWQ